MSSASVETLTKMLESLPDSEQDRVVEHLREYIEILSDELNWSEAFEKTQSRLVEAAQRAKEEIATGKTEPMDYDRL